MYNDCSIWPGGGGDPRLFLSDNVLDTKGGGVSPSHGGDFFGFCCVIRFKLTSILAPNV